MGSRELKNKPLVEAILEIRWALQQKLPGVTLDPHYRLLLGRLYDRMHEKYPEHEQLESANIPDEMAGQVVQHRFRSAPGDWPLVQVGPGVLTINDTHRYTWDDFHVRILDAKDKLYASHPKPEELRVETLMLRYIDAVELDYRSSSVFEFLRDKLKVNVEVPSSLFDGTQVEPTPQHFQALQVYRSLDPKGVIQLKVATGQKANQPALIWETTLQTKGADLPDMPKGFEGWVDAAHKLVNDWFFKMIEGDLHRRFSDG